MTDLVKKCRDVAYESRSHDGESEALNDAADEIERLRALHLERTKLTTKALNERDQNAAEIERLREIEKKAFFAGFSSGFSSCSAGLPGLTHNKERDYEVWRCRQATAGEGQKR